MIENDILVGKKIENFIEARCCVSAPFSSECMRRSRDGNSDQYFLCSISDSSTNVQLHEIIAKVSI